MSQVKSGDKIKVHYTGKLEDGEGFDSSREREPLEFTVGAGNVIPGFDTGVIGMAAGDQKTVTIEAEQAYGMRRDELMLEVKKDVFPDNITPEVGQQLKMDQPDGQAVDVVVSEMKGEMVTLDANHPLAGKTLIFEIELVTIV